MYGRVAIVEFLLELKRIPLDRSVRNWKKLVTSVHDALMATEAASRIVFTEFITSC